MRCELPNAKLYKFDGAVVGDPSQPHIPLTIDNLLLRGCTLRKTSWVVSDSFTWLVSLPLQCAPLFRVPCTIVVTCFF